MEDLALFSRRLQCDGSTGLQNWYILQGLEKVHIDAHSVVGTWEKVSLSCTRGPRMLPRVNCPDD